MTTGTSLDAPKTPPVKKHDCVGNFTSAKTMKIIILLMLFTCSMGAAEVNLFTNRADASRRSGADVVFTNQSPATFTNKAGRIYERVRLTKTSAGFLYVDYVGTSGG